MENLGVEASEPIAGQAEDSVLESAQRTQTLALRKGILFAAFTGLALGVVAGSVHNFFGVETLIPAGGDRNSIVVAATPTPHSERLIPQSGPNPEPKFGENYTRKAYDSLHAKDPQTNKSILNRMTENGYKILKGQDGIIVFEEPQIGTVKDGRYLDIQKLPIPFEDGNFAENTLVGRYKARDLVTLYGGLAVYDPQIRLVTLFAFTHPSKSDSTGLAWADVGIITSDGRFESDNVSFDQEFIAALLKSLFPGLVNPKTALNQIQQSF